MIYIKVYLNIVKIYFEILGKGGLTMDVKRMRGDPDKGPSQKHGSIPFDKGYRETSDDEPYFPEKAMRGNNYEQLQDGVARADAGKIKRDMRRKV
jgi:hypothetical protein